MARYKYQEWITKNGLTKLSAWARDGLTDDQMANNIGINVSTLYEWKKRHPEISEALKINKELADIEVENSLYKNATGYTYPEEQTIKLKEVYWDKKGRRCEKERVEIVTVLKTKPSETLACIYWLNNRKPSIWRQKREEEEDKDIRVFFDKNLEAYAK